MKRNALLLCLLVAFAAQLQAQAVLGIQGVIKNADGSAVSNGKYSLQFKLYTAASGGTAVWTETQPQVQVTGGIYSALLGEVTPLENVPFNQAYFLGVAFDGGAELIPRARLTTTPYAFALTGQSNVFPSTGPVGIGTPTPLSSTDLHVKDSGGDATLLVESPANIPRVSLKDADQTGELRVESNTLHLHAKDNLPLVLTGNNIALLPSPGRVGIGFTPGTTDGDFHIKKIGSGEVRAVVESSGTGDVELHLKNNFGGGAGSAGGLLLDGADLKLQTETNPFARLILSGANGLTVEVGNSPWIQMESTSNVIDIKKKVVISGPSTVNSIGQYFMMNLSGTSGPFSSTTTLNAQVGLETTGGIHAIAFRATSDRRIKKNFRISDSAGDLASLMRLRITDYQYVDEVSRGNSSYKGLVAQEVREIMPQAVAVTEGFIPDIYLLAENTSLQGGQLTIHTPREHQLAAGDQVRLILEEGVRELSVAATPDTRSFAVSWAEAAPQRVFVYGKKVDDFQQVDYDKVHNLAISAIQELSRQVDALKAENAGLKSELKASVDDFERRLRTLETKISN